MSALRPAHRYLRAINDRIVKLAMALGIFIVGFMVLALTASAVTRYTTGTGYDAYIEMPRYSCPDSSFPCWIRCCADRNTSPSTFFPSSSPRDASGSSE